MEPEKGKSSYRGQGDERSLHESDRVGESLRDDQSARADKAVRPRGDQPGRSETPLESARGNAGFPKE